MFRLQEFIHRLEEGSFSRIIQLVFVILVLVTIGVTYNLRGFRNMEGADAMDAAQLARNLAEGRGFVTDNISPLSMHLVRQRNNERIEMLAEAGVTIDPKDYLDEMKLRNNHPALESAPFYPLLLSLYMRVIPFEFSITRIETFERYQPDLLIAIFNQVLLGLCAMMVFLLGGLLFDSAVAWLSMILFVGTDLYWKFSSSGNSTILLLLLFLLLLWSLAKLENGMRVDSWPRHKIILFGALIGLLLSLGFLTRYAFGWLLVPTLLFLMFYGGSRRLGLILTVLSVCFLICTPWIQRNNRVSGTPFGTAGYSVYQLTTPYPGDKLQRMLEPEAGNVLFKDYVRKFRDQGLEIFKNELPTLGGTWMTAFFLVGLLVVYQDRRLNRIRGFVLVCLGMFVVVQALGRTQLSIDTPVVNSENLLILLGPAVILFGVSLFFTLLDQWNVKELGARVALIGMFAALISLPLLFTLLSRTYAVAYPPYYPPVFQLTANWLRPNEQMMSDVPAAVAWYGKRQCLLWTLNPAEDFYAIYDYQKPINAVYLSPKALDRRFLTGLLKGPNAPWGRSFLVNAIARVEIPREFPLKFAPPQGFLPQAPDAPGETTPEHFFLTDRIRW